MNYIYWGSAVGLSLPCSHTCVTFSVTFWERSFTLEGLSSSILGVGGEQHSGPLLGGPTFLMGSESDMELCWLSDDEKSTFVVIDAWNRSCNVLVFFVFFLPFLPPLRSVFLANASVKVFNKTGVFNIVGWILLCWFSNFYWADGSGFDGLFPLVFFCKRAELLIYWKKNSFKVFPGLYCKWKYRLDFCLESSREH